MTLPAVDVALSPEDKFQEYLRSRARPQRYTGQQRDMVKYIFGQHSHFDADTLIEDLKRQGFKPTPSRATVYRTLNKLVDAGLLRRIDIGPRMYYEHDYGYPQHEHMYCEKCHKMIEFQHTVLESILREVAQKEGFQVQGHTLLIRGVCGDCNQARMTRRRLDLV